MNVYELTKNNNQPDDSSKTIITYIGFNQTNTLFAVGTNMGFNVFSTNPVKARTSNKFQSEGTAAGGVGWVEMLFSSNIFALVGGGPNPAFSTDQVILWDDQKKQYISEHQITCSKQVRGVRLHKNLVVVILEDKIMVYDHELKELFRRETVSNTQGLCVISPDTESTVLAFPGVNYGMVRVENISTQKKSHIKAHETEIACLALNRDGTLLATASTKGTLIRIFDTDTGNKVRELRRGSTAAKIFSIAFSQDSKYLACISESGTVHLWTITQESGKNKTSAFSFVSYVVDFGGIVSSEWSMTEYKDVKVPAICAFGTDSSLLYVLNAHGEFLTIKFDLEKGEPPKLVSNKDILSLITTANNV